MGKRVLSASLQARHQRDCGLGRPWTSFDDARKGCTCRPGPMYHLAHRWDGRLVREPVGKDRQAAQRALQARLGELADGTYRPAAEVDAEKAAAAAKVVTFAEFSERWLSSLSSRSTTARAYGYSMRYAVEAFGATPIGVIGAADVRRMLDLVREQARGESVSPATLAKHLRHVSACLGAAVAEGYATVNAVKLLHKTQRPKVAKSRPAYFTDAELARLWPALDARPVYSMLCKVAVATGLRQGELFGLKWSDIDLLNGELHVLRTYTIGVGETPPKSGEPRTIDLTPQARALLEAWWAATGDEGLVFESESGGYLDSAYVRKVLYAALAEAGVPRVGERGRKRDFHSLRHSFARIALSSGAPLQWVQRQLGHSSIVLTADTYGTWAREAEKAQAEKLAGAFPV